MKTKNNSGTTWLRSGTGFQALALLLLFILGLRILGLFLANTELYFDEAQYWAWSRELAFGYFTKPPLLAWIIAAFTNVCGDNEACVRLASPVLNTATALPIYALALRLYDKRVAFWAALVYATLPGISFSSTVISTDVPLLLCWSGALLALYHHIEKPRLLPALALGLCLGLGLNAKYAMIYFLPCAAIYFIAAPQARHALRAASTWLALLLAALLIFPNILWNVKYGFPTVHHVAENAGWQGGLHPLKALEFIGCQFGVLGPLLFASYLFAAIDRVKSEKPSADNFLLSFSLPVLLLLTGQALMARALANWAAVAFPAATILATALLLRKQKLFSVSLLLHFSIMIVLLLGGIFAPNLRLPSGEAIYKRVLGWNEVAKTVEAVARKERLSVIAIEGRPMTAEMLYYLRDKGFDIRGAMARNAAPANHFELTRPWHFGDTNATLLLSVNPPANFGIPKEAARHLTMLPPRVFVSREPYGIYAVTKNGSAPE